MAHKVCSSPPDGSQSWIVAPLSLGILSTYRISGETTYLEWVRQWGGSFGMGRGDNGCRGQVWTDLYRIDPQDEYIRKTRDFLDKKMQNDTINGIDYWGWCDLLFMEPPVWAAMGAIGNNSGYWDEMTRRYFDVYDTLYDTEEKLMFRDRGKIDNKTDNGEKEFWSRGNGWVVGGLCRILDNLPQSYPDRYRFTDLFIELSTTLKNLQAGDGLWVTNLLDSLEHPVTETSGSAFFCYAFAWGLNNGVLGEEFRTPAENAWKGLVSKVDETGTLRFVQKPATGPGDVSADGTADYATGAFLMAAEQMFYRWAIYEYPFLFRGESVRHDSQKGIGSFHILL